MSDLGNKIFQTNRRKSASLDTWVTSLLRRVGKTLTKDPVQITYRESRLLRNEIEDVVQKLTERRRQRKRVGLPT